MTSTKMQVSTRQTVQTATNYRLKVHYQKLGMRKLNIQEVDWNGGEATPAGTARGRDYRLEPCPRKASDPEWKSTPVYGEDTD